MIQEHSIGIDRRQNREEWNLKGVQFLGVNLTRLPLKFGQYPMQEHRARVSTQVIRSTHAVSGWRQQGDGMAERAGFESIFGRSNCSVIARNPAIPSVTIGRRECDARTKALVDRLRQRHFRDTDLINAATVIQTFENQITYCCSTCDGVVDSPSFNILDNPKHPARPRVHRRKKIRNPFSHRTIVCFKAGHFIEATLNLNDVLTDEKQLRRAR